MEKYEGRQYSSIAKWLSRDCFVLRHSGEKRRGNYAGRG